MSSRFEQAISVVDGMADMLVDSGHDSEGRKLGSAADEFRHCAEQRAALLEALKELDKAGRDDWHFQHKNTNATTFFAIALKKARTAIALAQGGAA